MNDIKVANCLACHRGLNVVYTDVVEEPKPQFGPVESDSAGSYLVCPRCQRKNIVASFGPHTLRVIGLRAD